MKKYKSKKQKQSKLSLSRDTLKWFNKQVPISNLTQGKEKMS